MYIEHADALYVIKYWDNPDAVFYVDPPYHAETRRGGEYTHEADHDHHVALVETLLACRGAVVLSGYEHSVYDPLTSAGWRLDRYRRSSYAAGRTRTSPIRGAGAANAVVPRVECIWSNPRALELLGARSLFDLATTDHLFGDDE